MAGRLFEQAQAAGLLRILDAAPDAFVSMDADGVVRTWNVAAERLLGWSECEAVGRPLSELLSDRAGAEEQSRAAFEASPLGMAITDDLGRYVQVNAAYARMLGYEPAALAGCDSREFTDPDDAAGAARVPAGVRQVRLVRADGTRVWARVTITAIRGPDGGRRLLV
ncbi:PAS domain S-box protein [Actinoplanes sp. NPDC051861]|uniref:PAS domain S-box protein n=1 Tax=Actinoplanes sp. NPDC051861 TaxID=3155170 RepID=UPI003449F9EC